MMKHNSTATLRSIPRIKLTFSAISIFFSIVLALAAFGDVSQGTSWSYQGQLRRSGAAYTGTCNFQFSLWSAVSAGGQVGSTQPINGVNVVNGLFTVTLDFGDAFTGFSVWLATSVQCSGDGGFTALDPRQPISATPYALTLRPGASIYDYDTASTGPTLYVRSFSTNASALVGQGQTGVSGYSFDDLGTGVSGSASGLDSSGVHGYSSGTDASSGVSGIGDTLARAGVQGYTLNPNGSGVYGTANGANAAGVFGMNSSGAGVWGRSTGAGSAVYGENTGTGFAGRFTGPVSVANTRSSDTGVDSTSFIGVHGKTNDNGGSGVSGEALLANSAGVFGSNRDSAAIWGHSSGVGSAIYGENVGTGFAGRFIGPVSVQGTLSKSAGSFQIDHPLDPANKFLSHSFVESPDMKNIYDGNITTDATGSATVTLPTYFAALNRDYRYQLTVLGEFAQAIISRKIAGNSFEIRTDKPGVEVSWQVTGIRQDAYAKEHPIVVEEFKPAEEKGLYLYPAGFGAGEDKRIGHLKGPALAPGVQEAPAAGSVTQTRSE